MMMSTVLWNVAKRSRRTVRPGVLTGAVATGLLGVALYQSFKMYHNWYATRPTDLPKKMGAQWGDAHQAITIRCSPDQVFSLFQNPESLAEIFSHLSAVESIDAERSRWTASGLNGVEISWDVMMTEDIPGRKLTWQSVDTETSSVRMSGSVTLVDAPREQGTEVHVDLRHKPSAAVTRAGIFRYKPEAQLADDLRRLKQRLELGTSPTIEGQPAGSVS